MVGINTWAKGSKKPKACGKNNHFWRGGVSKINRTERQNFSSTIEYKNWRRFVFERDNYTCQMCGVRGGVLHADHIKSYLYFKDLRLNINNGRTLCKDCHVKTDTWGIKVFKTLPTVLL